MATDLFEEMGFDTPVSRWDAERDDDFDTVTEDEDDIDFGQDEDDPPLYW